MKPDNSEYHVGNLNYYFENLLIFVFQVVSSVGGLQRDTSIDVEDEFHRQAPESSTEFQTEAPTEPGTQEGGIFPRAEETARTTEGANEAQQRVEDNVEGRLGADPESKENGVYPMESAVEDGKVESGNGVYPGMESAEDRENREAMEAWEAQRGIEGVGFR